MKTQQIAIAAGVLLAIGSLSLLRADEVSTRQQDQQARIDQGVKSGEMTQGEAARAEKQHKAIHKQIKADRAANGGKLTQGEKKDINKEQNKESRKIHRLKHNSKKTSTTAPAAN